MSKSGFTLIELLVVIAIMAIVGTFAVANYRSFGQDKDLESTALDIQSLVRTAQTNATTSLKCSGNSATIWKANFYEDSATSQRKVETACQYQGDNNWFNSKIYSFKENINLIKICGDSSCTCENNLSGDKRLEILLSSVSGSIYYKSFDVMCGLGVCEGPSSCFKNAPNISVNLKNTKTNSPKQVIIEKGGRVYVQ